MSLLLLFPFISLLLQQVLDIFFLFFENLLTDLRDIEAFLLENFQSLHFLADIISQVVERGIECSLEGRTTEQFEEAG